MRLSLVLLLSVALPCIAFAQNHTYSSAAIALCADQHVVATARKTEKKFFLQLGSRPAILIGRRLTRNEAERLYTIALQKELTAICTERRFAVIGLDFTQKFIPVMLENLFPIESPVVVIQTVPIDDTHNLVLIRHRDQKIGIELFDKNAGPISILEWGTDKYEFQIASFNSLIVQQLPQILYLKESIAGIKQPSLFLRYNTDGAYSLVSSDNGSTGTLATAGPANPIAGATGDTIKLKGSEVKVDIGGVKLNLLEIKRTGNNNVASSRAGVAVVASSLPKPERGDVIADRQIKCNDTLTFHLFAYTAKESPADSIILEVRKNGKSLDQTSIPANLSLIEFKLFMRKDRFKGLCTDAQTDNELSVFFTEYKTKMPFMLDADTGLSIVTVKPKVIAAVAQNVRADTTQKAATATTAKSTTDSGSTDSNPTASNIGTIADETSYAALLKLQGKSIPLDVDCGLPQQQFGFEKRTMLDIDSVVIQVFNNNVHEIDVVGKINGVPIQTVSNNNYGLGLRQFVDGGLSITFENGTHTLCFRNLFFVRPTENDAISYNIADGKYTFLPDSLHNTQKLLQKRFLDFVSLSAFLDLQSLNTTAKNKNVLTELYFNYPVKSKNSGQFTWTKYFYLNATLGFNLFNSDNNKMDAFYRPDSVFRTIPKDTLYSPAYYFKSIDLIKNNFLMVNSMMNIFSVDIKGANTLLEVNGGVSLMGSNLKYIDKSKGNDSITTNNLYSYGYIGEARIRFNPKVNFGVDFHVSYHGGDNPLTSDFRVITGKLNTETLVKSGATASNKRDYMQGELNLYFNPKNPKTSTDRGGFFLKVNAFKSLHFDEGHFMFLIGYSSDIKNFFK